MSNDPSKPSNGSPAYESPDVMRPSGAAPTEAQLEHEHPGGREAHLAAHDPYAALRVRDYRIFAGAFLVAVIGAQVQTVAVGWEIYAKTGSALNLGWLGLVMAVPVFLLALPAGHVADTHSRRRIMMCTSVVSGTCALGLALLSYFWSRWEFSLTGIYALMFIGNAGATFGRPARAALMPQLVPPSIFSNAVTWNSSIFETASMAGPALGGFICAFSIPTAYVVTAACWLASGFLIWFIPNREPPRRGAPATVSDLVAGLRFVWRTKLMLGTMTLDLFAVLLGGVIFLLPIFATKIGGGAVTLGWFRAAIALGAATMALCIAHFPPFRRAGRTLLLSVAAFGAATIVFGFSTSFWLSFAMLVLVGAFDNVSVVIRHSLLQLLTPDHMRGRVAAINQIFIGSSNEIGGLRAGVMAAFFGEVFSVVIGGIGTVLVVMGVGSIWPQVARLRSLKDIRPLADEDEHVPESEAPAAARGFEVVTTAPAPDASKT